MPEGTENSINLDNTSNLGNQRGRTRIGFNFSKMQNDERFFPPSSRETNDRTTGEPDDLLRRDLEYIKKKVFNPDLGVESFSDFIELVKATEQRLGIAYAAEYQWEQLDAGKKRDIATIFDVNQEDFLQDGKQTLQAFQQNFSQIHEGHREMLRFLETFCLFAPNKQKSMLFDALCIPKNETGKANFKKDLEEVRTLLRVNWQNPDKNWFQTLGLKKKKQVLK